MIRLIKLSVLICALGVHSFAASIETRSLETGYRQMYNLDFVSAHQTFQGFEQAHPEDPLGPVSNAAAYLFAEFDRLHILEVELFTDDNKFEHRDKPTPDPHARDAFYTELTKADQLADRTLSQNPSAPGALFAKILTNGLRGDYLALIEKKNFAGLGYIKTARGLAGKLLAADPSYYDAYLAVGVENYLLSTNPAPVRWFLRLSGAQTDKDEGIKNLKLAAEKGHYLAPYARLLLAVAALRDHDPSTARNLLSGLSQEFPNNRLYKNELARLH